MAENNKTRFFYFLYSDKTRVFDQSERAYYPIYIINIYNTPNNFFGLSLDKTDHVIQNGTMVIRRYPPSDFISTE